MDLAYIPQWSLSVACSQWGLREPRCHCVDNNESHTVHRCTSCTCTRHRRHLHCHRDIHRVPTSVLWACDMAISHSVARRGLSVATVIGQFPQCGSVIGRFPQCRPQCSPQWEPLWLWLARAPLHCPIRHLSYPSYPPRACLGYFAGEQRQGVASQSPNMGSEICSEAPRGAQLRNRLSRVSLCFLD